MGINSFSAFLKKRAPETYFEVPLRSLNGERLAIDMGNLLFQMMSVATKDVVLKKNLSEGPPETEDIHYTALNMVMHRLVVFMEYGITPVCVFDGKTHELKELTREKRRKIREKILGRLEEAKHNLYSVEPLLRTNELVQAYGKYLCQYISVPYDFTEHVQNVLRSVGFPVLCVADFNIQTQDAEGLCASLCLERNKYCWGGVTTDSDFHVYGGNNAITEIYTKREMQNDHIAYDYYAKVRSLDKILEQSKLNFEQFRDLCILMGTDFNKNIPKIGPVRSWGLLQQFGTIPNIEKECTHLDTKILNYKNVKNMFSSTLFTPQQLSLDFDVVKFRYAARSVFESCDLPDYASKISCILANNMTLQC